MNRWMVVLGRDRQSTSSYARTLAHTVADIHHGTSATLAVVAHSHSGNYRDVAYLFGASVAFCSLLVILFLPWEFNDFVIPLDVVFFFALAAWSCDRTRLRRWLTTRHRRRRQVHNAAAAAFVHEGLIHAAHDAGVLIYWSRLERQIDVIADTGVLAVVPAERWHAMVFALHRVAGDPHPASALLEQIRALGKLLAVHLPASQDHSHRLTLRHGNHHERPTTKKEPDAAT
jgi:uncharacterized membrane protein